MSTPRKTEKQRSLRKECPTSPVPSPTLKLPYTHQPSGILHECHSKISGSTSLTRQITAGLLTHLLSHSYPPSQHISQWSLTESTSRATATDFISKAVGASQQRVLLGHLSPFPFHPHRGTVRPTFCLQR